MSAFTIYEKHPTADAYRVGGFYSPYALVATDKRFSGAELMAEYWMQLWGLIPFKKNGRANTRGKTARHEVLTRFVTLPHASESDYQ